MHAATVANDVGVASGTLLGRSNRAVNSTEAANSASAGAFTDDDGYPLNPQE
jgi:hypothetical protein